MRTIGIVFLILLAFGQVQAQVILISDIDDTIKNSHILDRSESVVNAGKIQNLLLGMNVAFHAIRVSDPSVKYFYVSNAPASLMERNHRDFLSLHRFPSGSLRLRPSLFQNDFKVKEIRRILQEEKPSKVILLGDNGEKDVLIYSQIVKEHPHIHFVSYIHQPYSFLNQEDPGVILNPGQIGFITSLDLLLHLRQIGLVSSQDATAFVQGFITAFQGEEPYLKTGTLAIPAWNDCRDFRWTAQDEDLMQYADYVAVKERIVRRCRTEAIND